MTPQQHSRVQDAFFAASEAPEADRARLLDELCAGDEEVRSRVFALLDAESNAASKHGWLETPVLGRVVSEGILDGVQAPAAVGEVGPYRIIRCVGEGGMGVVYEAEQRSPQRRVALKLVRPGLGSAHIMRRFQHESEILGLLEHPGIARIYEAGVAPVKFSDGSRVMSPFFAMEFVDGQPLTEFAADRGLSIEARLELFALVCDAVEYAHRRGVIHRDLKPANILVEGGIKGTRDQGTKGDKSASLSPAIPGSVDPFSPKILDFGVARLTGTDAAPSIKHSVLTQASALVGTLAYMSPEQVSGDASRVDTRSDMYALGACLYELLVGRPAIDVAGKPLNEAVRLVTEREPARLGTLDPRLRGDVEIIVRKALEKSPEDRYASAAALAADIRAYLRHDAIAAHPPSGVYQLRKFARRNRALVFVGSLGIGALVVGATLATIGLLEARHQRDVAEGEAEKARQDRGRALLSLESDRAASNFLMRVLFTNSVQPDSPTTLRALIDRAAANTKEFENRPLLRADLEERLANMYYEFRDFPRTIELLERSLEIRTRVQGPNHPRTLLLRADVTRKRSWTDSSACAAAEAPLREIHRLMLESPEATTAEIGGLERLLAEHFRVCENLPAWDEFFTRAIDGLCAPIAEDELACASARVEFAKGLAAQGQFARLEPILLPALDILERHPEAGFMDRLFGHFLLAAGYTKLQRLDEAERFCNEAIQLRASHDASEGDSMARDLERLLAAIHLLQERARAAPAPSGDAAPDNR